MFKRIFVYADEGTSPTSVLKTIEWLQRYTWLEVTKLMHTDLDHLKHCELLVIPGGRDLPYCKLLDPYNSSLLQYMYNGGKYLGICAGAYFACNSIEFELNTPLQVCGSRKFNLFNGIAKGAAFNQFEYNSEKGACVVDIAGNYKTKAYFNGGPYFIPNSDNYESIMTYTNDKLAIVKTKMGKGVAVLSGVHLEYDSHSDTVLNNTLKLSQHSRDKLNQFVLYKVFNLPRKHKNDFNTIVYSYFNTTIPNVLPSESPVLHYQEKSFNFESLSNYNFICATSLPSTQEWLMGQDNVPDNTICLALEQTKGKGRSQNTWISTFGALTVTYHSIIAIEYNKLPIIQCIVAEAICSAIHKQNKAFSSRIKIKWPNDIIDIERGIKIGGILISTDIQEKIHLYIGFGINVDNKLPTGCLSDIQPIEFVKFLKDCIDTIKNRLKTHEQSTQVFDSQLKSKFVSLWAHSNQIIHYKDKSMTIVDIADNGNLIAIENGILYDISSDNNRFDFWHNLIINKL